MRIPQLNDEQFSKLMRDIGASEAQIKETRFTGLGAIDVTAFLAEDGTEMAELKWADLSDLLHASKTAANKIAEIHTEHEGVLLAEAILREEHEELREKYNGTLVALAVVSGVAFALLGWILGRA